MKGSTKKCYVSIARCETEGQALLVAQPTSPSQQREQPTKWQLNKIEYYANNTVAYSDILSSCDYGFTRITIFWNIRAKYKI